MNRETKIRVVQVNLDWSMKVSAELTDAIVVEKIDVALVQELYVRNGKVCGLGSGRQFYSKNSDARPWACVIVNNNRLGAVQRNDLCSSYHVCNKLMLPEGNQPTIEIESCVRWMEEIERVLGRSKNVVIRKC